jgi:hypothetical protein
MMNTETTTESIVERNKFLEHRVTELTVLVKYYEEQFQGTRIGKRHKYFSNAKVTATGLGGVCCNKSCK